MEYMISLGGEAFAGFWDQIVADPQALLAIAGVLVVVIVLTTYRKR